MVFFTNSPSSPSSDPIPFAVHPEREHNFRPDNHRNHHRNNYLISSYSKIYFDNDMQEEEYLSLLLGLKLYLNSYFSLALYHLI